MFHLFLWRPVIRGAKVENLQIPSSKENHFVTITALVQQSPFLNIH
jgi:hypothetical protein